MAPRKKITTARKVKLAAFILLVLTLFALASIFYHQLPTPLEIRAMAKEYGAWAFVLFIPIAVALKVLLFPSSILYVAAGLMFGPIFGTVAAVCASTVAAGAQLLISRHVAGDTLRSKIPKKLHRFDSFIERKGWIAIIYLRILPVSSNLLNYSTGFTSLKLSHMLLGSVIGSIPLSFAYAFLGGSLSDLSSPGAVFAIIMVGLLGISGLVLGRRHIGEEIKQEES